MNPTINQPGISAPLLVLLLPGISTRRYWALIEALGSAEAILKTNPDTIKIFSPTAKTLIKDYQKYNHSCQLVDQACTLLEKIKNHHGHIISIDGPDYPQQLKHIHFPPPLLYLKGNKDNLSLPQLAFVGSRHATHQGLKNTARLSSHLSQHGFTITSGLALGIDGAAHQATVDAGGTTIAVMATGIDEVYPKRHGQLAENILASNGTLMTEFPPLTPPKPDHFPRRNRIISGLSLGVVVVEAAIKSGSLITANYANEQGREVFAVPGSIHNPQSKGCHLLIKNGATLVETSDDIVEELGGALTHSKQQLDTIDKATTDPKTPLDHQESFVLEHLGFNPETIEHLLHSTQLSYQVLINIIINLEIKGYIIRKETHIERVVD